MEKNGFHNQYALQILTLCNIDWGNRQQLERTKEFFTYQAGLEKTLKLLKDIKNKSDIDLIVKTEKLITEMELSLYTEKDPSALSSIQGAIAGLKDIENSISVVKNPEAYQESKKTHSSRKKFRDVIEDGFHVELKGQVTRLNNRIKSIGISIPEKNVLRQRKENLLVAKELYVDMQRKALGIECSKSKESELER